MNGDLREWSRRIDLETAAVLDRVVDDDWMRGAINYQLGWADEDFAAVPPDRRSPSDPRLRALLAVLAHQSALDAPASAAAGSDGTSAAELACFAAAVELVHNFSLIHDDIETGNRLRGGRPALWTLLDASPALEVGNCIHALAHTCLAGAPERGDRGGLTGDLVGALARSTVEWTAAQRRDISGDPSDELDPDTYVETITGKSAALASCATYGGALLALGADTEIARRRADCYAEFGRQLGVARQIRDDILGICGADAETGTPGGSDMRLRRKGLPVVFARREADGEAADRLRYLCSLSTELTEEQEREVRDVVAGCDAVSFAQHQAELHGERALQALTGAAEGLETDGSLSRLRDLVAAVTAPTH